MVTRKEVAERAGVSVATVSNVFTKKVYVLPETVRKVEEAAQELKYVPNFTARSLSLGHSYQIGIAVSECTNPYHAELFEAMSDYSSAHGFMVTLFAVNERFRNAMNFLHERQFDAFVNFSNQMFPEGLVEMLERKNTLLVNFGAQKGLESIMDFYGVMTAAMEEVSRLGHKRVGYVSTMDEMRYSADLRGKAFRDNRKQLGFDEDEELIVYNGDYTQLSETIGYRNMKQLLARGKGVTAVFTTNDLAAFGAMCAVKEAGLRVPEDISIIGCDGISLGEYTSPRLSTLWFDKTEHGVQLAKTVIDAILNGDSCAGKTVIAKGKLLLRNSLAKCPNV